MLEGISIGVLLGAQTGGGYKVVRDDLERRAVVFFDDGAVQGTGELSIPRTLRADYQVRSIRKCHERV